MCRQLLSNQLHICLASQPTWVNCIPREWWPNGLHYHRQSQNHNWNGYNFSCSHLKKHSVEKSLWCSCEKCCSLYGQDKKFFFSFSWSRRLPWPDRVTDCQKTEHETENYKLSCSSFVEINLTPTVFPSQNHHEQQQYQ